MCATIWNSVKSVGSAIVDKVDRCAIQLNRRSPCVRKTTAAFAIVILPNLLFLGSQVGYMDKIPDQGVVWVMTLGGCVPSVATIVCLWNRYGFLLRPANVFLLPERIRALLAAEAANGELPEAYRNEVGAFVEQMDARERMFEENDRRLAATPAYSELSTTA